MKRGEGCGRANLMECECVRKLFTVLIMYYPLKIKNIVLYCNV